MIISSELTGETYKTVEDCLKAEEVYKKAKAEEERAKKEHQKMLDEAYEEAIAACDKYLRLAGFRKNKVVDCGTFEDFDSFLNEIVEIITKG